MSDEYLPTTYSMREPTVNSLADQVKFLSPGTGMLPKATEVATVNPLDKQVGGNHYKELGIQPVEYIHANGLDFFQGSVIKYVTRWKGKGGISDLEKAMHFLELYIELETKRGSK